MLTQPHRSVAVLVGLLTALVGAAPSAWAAPPKSSGDLGRIENELREQRTTLMQLLRAEQERSAALTRLIETRCGALTGADTIPPRPRPVTPLDDDRLMPASPVAVIGGDSLPAGGATASIRGRVQGQGDLQNVYVYLDGLRSSGKGKTLEIVQRDKQFSPNVAVAVAGTMASFPNHDAIFHNVFSSSPKPFDLGTRRAGDPVPQVVLGTPGIVELNCNIHSRMTAKVLVVPNRLFVKVQPDGTFRLEHVPLGRRKVVAWGPSFKPQRRDVDLGAAGAEVAFELEVEPPKPRVTKQGLPLGSYKE